MLIIRVHELIGTEVKFIPNRISAERLHDLTSNLFRVMIDSNPTRCSSICFGILYLLGCLAAAIVIPPRNSRCI